MSIRAGRAGVVALSGFGDAGVRKRRMLAMRMRLINWRKADNRYTYSYEIRELWPFVRSWVSSKRAYRSDFSFSAQSNDVANMLAALQFVEEKRGQC